MLGCKYTTLEGPFVELRSDVCHIPRLVFDGLKMMEQLLGKSTEWLNKVGYPARDHLLGCIGPSLLPNLTIAEKMRKVW